MKLKVYGIGWMGRTRRIVATTSKKKAAELIGTSQYHFSEYGCETGNKREVELAMSKPGTVFEQQNPHHNGPWREVSQ